MINNHISNHYNLIILVYFYDVHVIRANQDRYIFQRNVNCHNSDFLNIENLILFLTDLQVWKKKEIMRIILLFIF